MVCIIPLAVGSGPQAVLHSSSELNKLAVLPHPSYRKGLHSPAVESKVQEGMKAKQLELLISSTGGKLHFSSFVIWTTVTTFSAATQSKTLERRDLKNRKLYFNVTN